VASTKVSVELNKITEAKHDDRTKPWRVGAGGFARRQLPQAEPQALAAALTAAGLTAQARPRAAKPGLLARLVKDGLIDVDHGCRAYACERDVVRRAPIASCARWVSPAGSSRIWTARLATFTRRKTLPAAAGPATTASSGLRKSAVRSGEMRKLGDPVALRTAIRVILPCTLALVCAGAAAGCGGSSASGSSNLTEPTGEAAVEQRNEEAAHKKEETEETNKNRELLSEVEAKKREESAEEKAKTAEATAEARAKKREHAAAAEAKKKVAAAEANAKKREEAVKAEVKKKEEASKKSTEVKVKSPSKPQVRTQTTQAIPLKVTE
jgi:hypothetical protein